MKSLQIHLAVIQFLNLIIGHLPDQIATALSVNKLVLDPFDLYIAFDISGAGAGETTIMDTDTKKLVGVCSFDPDGQLNDNKVAVFEEAVVLCGSNVAAGVDVRTLAFTQVMPVEVANSEIVIYQRGQEVLRSPMSQLNGKVGSSSRPDVYRELKSPRFLVPNEDITIKVEVPKGITIPVGTYIKLLIPSLITRKL